MFGKYLKFQISLMKRLYIATPIIVIVFGTVIPWLIEPLSLDTRTYLNATVQFIVITMIAVGFVFMPMLIILSLEFEKNESYLLNTIPITPKTKIWVTMLHLYIAVAIALLLVIIFESLMLRNLSPLDAVWDSIDQWFIPHFENFTEFLENLSIVSLWGLLALTPAMSVLAGMLLCALPWRFGNRIFIQSVFGICGAIVLGTVYYIAIRFFFMESENDVTYEAGLRLRLYGSGFLILCGLIACVVFYFFTERIMRKHINLI
ncbi:MAG: hypothetical protein LBM87_03905 [Ruminococcus sp.]|jgi:hypothetical protein|nr:hypothetical protein [Ruminococcus sp.]